VQVSLSLSLSLSLICIFFQLIMLIIAYASICLLESTMAYS
jgi:hypothetical protein